MAFDYEGAIAAGYTPSEIADYLGKTNKFDVAGARKAGYDDFEIISHLNTPKVTAPKAPQKEGFLPGLKEGVISAYEATKRGVSAPFQTEEDIRAGYEQQKAEAEARNVAYTPFSAIPEAYEKEGLGAAVGTTYDAARDAFSRSLPFMAPTIAGAATGARLGALTSPVTGFVGPIVGGLVGGVAGAVPQFAGTNIERRIEENTPGPLVTPEVYQTATGQAALDTAATMFTLGTGLVAKILGRPIATVSEQQLLKTAERSLTGTVGRGAARGALSEMPTEVAQQILERRQAGLDLTSEDAYREYGEVAAAAGVLGGAFGGVGNIVTRGKARDTVEAQEQLREAELAEIQSERDRVSGMARAAQQQALAQQKAEEDARAAYEASLRVPLTTQTELELAPETTIEEVAAKRAAQSPQDDLFVPQSAPPEAPEAPAEAAPTLNEDTIKLFGFKKNSLAYKALEGLNNPEMTPAEQVKRFDQIIENNQAKIKSKEQEEAVSKFKQFMQQRLEKERVDELRSVDTRTAGESADLFGGPVPAELSGRTGEPVGDRVDGDRDDVRPTEVGANEVTDTLDQTQELASIDTKALSAEIKQLKKQRANLKGEDRLNEVGDQLFNDILDKERTLRFAKSAQKEAPVTTRITPEQRQQRLIQQRAEAEAARKTEKARNAEIVKATQAKLAEKDKVGKPINPSEAEGLQAAQEFEEEGVEDLDKSVISGEYLPDIIASAIAEKEADVENAKKHLAAIKLMDMTLGDETTAAGVAKAQQNLANATAMLNTAYKHYQSLPKITNKLEQREYAQAIKDIEQQGFMDAYGISLLKAIENNDAKKALTIVAKDSTAPHLRLVANMLLKSKTFPHVSFFNFGVGEESTAGGYSAANDYVTMDTGRFLQRAYSRQAKDLDRVLLHEMIHSATVNTLSGGYRVSEVSKVLGEGLLTTAQKADLKYKNSAENIVKIFDYLATIDELKDQYGMTNPLEMLAEAFTNSKFQKALKDIKVPADLGITDIKPSIWDTFINSLKKLLGIEATPDSALSKVLSEGANLIDQRSTFKTRVQGTSSQLKGRDSLKDKYGGEGDADRSISTEPTGDGLFRDLVSPRVQDARLNLGALVRKITPKLLSVYQLVDQFGAEMPALQQYSELNDKMTMTQQRLKNKAQSLLSEWGAFSFKNPAMHKKLGKLMLDATRSKIHPDEEIGAEANAHLTDDMVDKYEELSNAYNALSPEAKQIYQRARALLQENFNLRRTIYNDMVRGAYAEDLAEATPEEAKKINDRIEKSIKEHELLLNEMRGPYFPLMRFGEYLVVAESDELRELREELAASEGKERKRLIEMLRQMEQSDDHYQVHAFEKRSEQAREAARLSRTGMNIRETKSEDYMNNIRANSFGAIDQLEKIFDREIDLDVDPAQMRQLRQAMIDSVLAGLPENSALQRQIKRRNIAGATENMLQAFAETMERDSHYLSRMGYMKPLSKSLIDMRNQSKNDMQLRDVYNNVRARMNLDMRYDNHPILSKLTGISSIYHLGIAPSYLLQNMTQPFMITVPQLAGRYGAAKTSKAVIGAWKDASKAVKGGRNGKFFSLKDTDLSNAFSGGELKMVQMLQDLGKLDIANNMDTEVYTKGMSPKMIKFWNMFNWSSHNIELMNRLSSALAAYRLEKGKGSSDEGAAKAARDAVELTQLDYSDTNAAYFMKQGHMGGMNRIPMQFRKYQQGMIYLLARNFKNAWGGDKEAKRAFFYLMGTQLLMAGVRGVPVAAPLLFLMGAFGDEDDKEGDLETQLRNSLADSVGPETARVFWKGLPAMLGLDSGSMSMENLFLPFPMMRSSAITDAATGKDAVTEFMYNLGGAPVSMLSRFGDALILGGEGDYQKALEKVLPKFMSSIVKAERLGSEGLTTRSGNVAIEAEEFDAWDQAIKSLGFTPTKESEYYQAMYAKERISQAIDDRRNAIIKAIATARLSGEDTAEALEQAREFNTEHPTRRITGDSIKRSVAQRRKDKQQRSESGVRYEKRERDIRDVTRYAN